MNSAFDVNYVARHSEILFLWYVLFLSRTKEAMQRAMRSRESIRNYVLLCGVDISDFIPNVVHYHDVSTVEVVEYKMAVRTLVTLVSTSIAEIPVSQYIVFQ